MVMGTEFLLNVSFFANLTTQQLEPLAQRLVARKYRGGEEIFRQGSPGNCLYIVRSGLVDVVVERGDQSRVLAQFGPRQVFGEFGLLDGLPRSAGAITREHSELLILSRSDFFLYLEQHPSVALNLIVVLSRRLRFAMQRTERGADLAEEPLLRLARLLVNLSERYGDVGDGAVRIPLRLTLGEIAGMMGCPRVEAETAMETLRSRRIVDWHGLTLTILDLKRLQAVLNQP